MTEAALPEVSSPWSLTAGADRRRALGALDQGEGERAAALAALERLLPALAATPEPDREAVPEALREGFPFFVDDLAQEAPTLAEATPERFAELFDRRGYAPEVVAGAEATRRVFVHDALTRSVEDAVDFLFRRPGPESERVAELIGEHAPGLPPRFAGHLLALVRLGLGERAVPLLERVANDAALDPGLVTRAESLLRELGHGAKLRAVLRLARPPAADPLRSWLEKALGGREPTLYDATDALERADGEARAFVHRESYGEYPFTVRVLRGGEGADVVVDFPDRDPPPEWLEELLTSGGRMLRAEAAVAAPAADLDRALAAAASPRGAFDVPRLLWVPRPRAAAFADAAELAHLAWNPPDGSLLMRGP